MSEENKIEVTVEKLKKYFEVTGKALEMAKNAPIKEDTQVQAEDFLDMASRYVSDAKHFEKQGNRVLAFAALNYAHGWLDAGARIKLFEVYDSTLFTVDEKGE
jgi:hypothetical protein